jgi:hypothetical protein
MNFEVRRAGRELNRPVGKVEVLGNPQGKVYVAAFFGYFLLLLTKSASPVGATTHYHCNNNTGEFTKYFHVFFPAGQP